MISATERLTAKNAWSTSRFQAGRDSTTSWTVFRAFVSDLTPPAEDVERRE